jgi:ParB family transcriptional regulator, chromosome partitioning protein
VADSRPRRGLGRGLSSLLGEPAPVKAGPLREVEVERIRANPDQPRRAIDPAALAALVDSVRESGLVQPVVVRPVDDGYELIAGERRWRAAREAGLRSIPALIREADARERLELALVENVVREDLNPIELAGACATLVEDFGQTHEQVGRRLGRSRAAITNLIRLLELPEDVQQMVGDGALTEGHARAVLTADGAAARRRVAGEAARRGLTVRATEELARRGPAGGSGRSQERLRTPLGDAALEVFGATFDAPVRVRAARSGEVVVELRFEDEDRLRAALERLGGG